MQDNKAVAIECWENMMPRTATVPDLKTVSSLTSTVLLAADLFDQAQRLGRWATARPAHPSSCSSPPFRRPAVVLCLPVSEPTLHGTLDAAGARSFACRWRWGRQVAYHSQFLDRDNLAHRGQARVKSRLCLIGGFDPNEWTFHRSPNG